MCCDVSDDLQAPIYDFKVSKRVGYKTLKVPASRVVIVEGIYALSARIRLRHPFHTTNSQFCLPRSRSWTAEAVQARLNASGRGDVMHETAALKD